MYILSNEEMYYADKFTTKELNLTEEMLMENSGQAALIKILEIANKTDKITIFCGKGNNGGDGICIARRLKNLNYQVNLVLVDGAEYFKNPAKYHFNIYKKHGYKFFELENSNLNELILKSNIIIDAIFGIGFKGNINIKYENLINNINKSGATVISIDIPSGISANEKENFIAVKADYTITISYLKTSAFSYSFKENYGKIYIADAGIIFRPKFGSTTKQTWGSNEFEKTFTHRKFDISKHNAGSTLFIGGSNNMVGAALLFSKACLQAGIGLLKLAIPKYVKQFAISEILEATYCKTFEKDGFLENLKLENEFSTIACGPGLGRKEFSKKIIEKVISINSPIILDADALYFLNYNLLEKIKHRTSPTILTPHFGEMAKLCNRSINSIRKERFEISKEKAIEWNCFIVLKGPNTILTTPIGNQFVNMSGNEGLATGGTGDVLTGIIAAFVASAENIQHAISNAIYVHGKTADIAVANENSKTSLTATDLVKNLSKMV